MWHSCLARFWGNLASSTRADGAFAINDGDRVVFYGDSITDQRLYTTFVETYIVTRFPSLNVSFVHSGWGGDRVSGGGGGPIDRRLARDVFAYKPTVVTVMLGMNDASYRPFQQPIFDTYSRGFIHLVESLKSHLPGVRITLIQPSPYDDVTRAPNFAGGYNQVLLHYAEFVKELAAKEGALVADLNTPVVAALKKAMEIDKKRAAELIHDRVHPGPGGQLLMAEALLKAWNAPALVTSVEIDAANGKVVQAENCARRRRERQRDCLMEPAGPVSAHADQSQELHHCTGGKGVGRRAGAQSGDAQGCWIGCGALCAEG